MLELLSEPVIISCAITENKTTLKMNPNLTITPKEQEIAAAVAVAAGASIINEPLDVKKLAARLYEKEVEGDLDIFDVEMMESAVNSTFCR